MTTTQTTLRQHRADTQGRFAQGPFSPRQIILDAQVQFAGGPTSDSHAHCEVQPRSAVGTLPESQADHDSHARLALGSFSPAAKTGSETIEVSRRGPILRGNGYLSLLADTLDDFEAMRTATANRVRALTRDVEDSDGEVRGLGLDERSPEVAAAKVMLANVEQLEHQQVLALQREFRKNPLCAWQKREKGVGEKQAARLLAVIGDPYWNDLHDRPRTVSELWAYCGYHVLPAGATAPSTTKSQAPLPGVAVRRKKGQLANWSTKAKTRAYLIAEKCVVAGKGGRYNALYYAEKERLVDAVHATDCHRCGPAGKPAIAGTELSPGHRHARALRKVAKEILKDLWIEARAIHEGATND